MKKEVLSVLESRLQFVLALLNERLKFANVRDAVLVIVLASGLLAVVGFIADHNARFSGFAGFSLWVAVTLWAVSLFLAVLSFVPRTRTHWLTPSSVPQAQDNHLFFADIAKFDTKTYLALLSASDGSTETEFTKEQQDYAEQIIVTARMIGSKLSAFRWSMWLGCIGLALILLLVLDFVGSRTM